METPYICPTSHDIIVPLIFAMKNNPSNRYIQFFFAQYGLTQQQQKVSS